MQLDCAVDEGQGHLPATVTRRSMAIYSTTATMDSSASEWMSTAAILLDLDSVEVEKFSK